jgi:hypothetical protein
MRLHRRGTIAPTVLLCPRRGTKRRYRCCAIAGVALFTARGFHDFVYTDVGGNENHLLSAHKRTGKTADLPPGANTDPSTKSRSCARVAWIFARTNVSERRPWLQLKYSVHVCAWTDSRFCLDLIGGNRNDCGFRGPWRCWTNDIDQMRLDEKSSPSRLAASKAPRLPRPLHSGLCFKLGPDLRDRPFRPTVDLQNLDCCVSRRACVVAPLE